MAAFVWRKRLEDGRSQRCGFSQHDGYRTRRCVVRLSRFRNQLLVRRFGKPLAKCKSR
jgi:hypothetical protein